MKKELCKILNNITKSILETLVFDSKDFSDIFKEEHIEQDFENRKVFCMKLSKDKFLIIELLIENWKITYLKFDFDTTENLKLNHTNIINVNKELKQNLIFGIDKKGRPTIKRILE
jgi:hypothetical protein